MSKKLQKFELIQYITDYNILIPKCMHPGIAGNNKYNYMLANCYDMIKLFENNGFLTSNTIANTQIQTTNQVNIQLKTFGGEYYFEFTYSLSTNQQQPKELVYLIDLNKCSSNIHNGWGIYPTEKQYYKKQFINYILQAELNY